MNLEQNIDERASFTDEENSFARATAHLSFISPDLKFAPEKDDFVYGKDCAVQLMTAIAKFLLETGVPTTMDLQEDMGKFRGSIDYDTEVGKGFDAGMQWVVDTIEQSKR